MGNWGGLIKGEGCEKGREKIAFVQVICGPLRKPKGINRNEGQGKSIK